MPSKIETSILDPESLLLALGELKSLFAACRWDWLEPDTLMLESFQKSWRLFGCWREGKMVGFARLISDGQIYGFLVDCMIHPEFRGRGLGSELVKEVLVQAESGGLKVIQLLASREGKPLYQKALFETCPLESPGMVKYLGRSSRH